MSAIQNFNYEDRLPEGVKDRSFIVTIAAIVQLTELVIQKTSPLLHQVLGIYLPLITTNCAVLAVAISEREAQARVAQPPTSASSAG